MPRKPKPKTLVWRNSRQLAGVRSQVQAAVNAGRDGETVTMPARVAEILLEVCDQAIHTERGHGV